MYVERTVIVRQDVNSNISYLKQKNIYIEDISKQLQRVRSFHSTAEGRKISFSIPAIRAYYFLVGKLFKIEINLIFIIYENSVGLYIFYTRHTGTFIFISRFKRNT